MFRSCPGFTHLEQDIQIPGIHIHFTDAKSATLAYESLDMRKLGGKPLLQVNAMRKIN